MKLTGYILMMEDGSMKYMTTDKTNKEPEFNGKKVKDRKVRVIPWISSYIRNNSDNVIAYSAYTTGIGYGFIR